MENLSIIATQHDLIKTEKDGKCVICEKIIELVRSKADTFSTISGELWTFAPGNLQTHIQYLLYTNRLVENATYRGVLIAADDLPKTASDNNPKLKNGEIWRSSDETIRLYNHQCDNSDGFSLWVNTTIGVDLATDEARQIAKIILLSIDKRSDHIIDKDFIAL